MKKVLYKCPACGTNHEKGKFTQYAMYIVECVFELDIMVEDAPIYGDIIDGADVPEEVDTYYCCTCEHEFREFKVEEVEVNG